MAPQQLQISQSLLDVLFEQAAEHPAEEICGLLAGKRAIVQTNYPIPNRSATPAYHFEFDGKEFIDAHYHIQQCDLQMLAIYHSHPAGAEGVPSATDIASANYPDLLNLILSFDAARQPISRVFRIFAGQASEIPLLITAAIP